MGVKKRGEISDRLVVESRIGIEQKHLVWRLGAGRRGLVQHEVVAAPEAVVGLLGVQGHLLRPVPLSWWALERTRCVIAGRGVVDNVNADPAPAVTPRQNAFHGRDGQRRGAVVDNDDRYFR